MVFLLNPLYNEIVDDCFELIIRSGFQIIKHVCLNMTQEVADDMFADKFGFDFLDGYKIMELMDKEDVHLFHLTKIAADREVRELYKESDLQFEDLIYATEWAKPLKPTQIPYLFFFLDSERTFEAGLK